MFDVMSGEDGERQQLGEADGEQWQRRPQLTQLLESVQCSG